MNIHLIIHYHNLYINMSNLSENEIISYEDNNSEYTYDILSEYYSEEHSEESITYESSEEQNEEQSEESSTYESREEQNEEQSEESSTYESSEDNNQNTQELNNNESKTQNNKCINYILCKKNIYHLNSIYCKPCYLYLHKKINYNINNINNNVCPLCLSNNSDDIILKLFTCDHTLCYKCVNNIYWNTNIVDIIKNPYPQIHKQWITYIRSIQSRKLKYYVIYKLVNNRYTDFNKIYNELITKINLKLIPSIFRQNLKDLVFYQSQYEIFKTNDNYNKFNMRESIQICPYCRAYK